MPTNQFKVHGQLPLHGMTVSAFSSCHQFVSAGVNCSAPASPHSPSYFGPRCPRSSRSLMFFSCAGPFSSCRSERVRMSGVYRTPSRCSASSSRWWWRRGRSRDLPCTDTVYFSWEWLQSGCLSAFILLRCWRPEEVRFYVPNKELWQEKRQTQGIVLVFYNLACGCLSLWEALPLWSVTWPVWSLAPPSPQPTITQVIYPKQMGVLTWSWTISFIVFLKKFQERCHFLVVVTHFCVHKMTT